ncbi:hypothetical protein Bca4012_043468 [Brassica carinata]
MKENRVMNQYLEKVHRNWNSKMSERPYIVPSSGFPFSSRIQKVSIWRKGFRYGFLVFNPINYAVYIGEALSIRALFSDLKAGKRLSIVEARLLRFSEARNVKRPSRFRLVSDNYLKELSPHFEEGIQVT